MPIGIKKPDVSKETQPSTDQVGGNNPNHRCCTSKGGDDFGKKILYTLFGVLLVYVILYVGTLMRNTVKKYDYIGRADQMERTITVNGYGKVSGKNDVAVTTIGFSNTDKDVAKAQADNKKVMDPVLAELKKMGFSDDDLQSSYAINPDYDYTDKGQQFKGYKVNYTITVKIRDLKKISTILSLPSKFGATEVSGLNFTIDDTDNLKNLARSKALRDAKQKAGQLSKSLGVVLGEVVSYGDYEMPQDYPMYARDAMSNAVGMGGPAEISPGSKDVAMNVSVTYKIYTGR